MIDDIKIIDNFLDNSTFDFIKELIVNNENFTWQFFNYKVTAGDGKRQFVHYIYQNDAPVSNYMGHLMPLFNKLDIASLRRVKINMVMPEETKKEGSLHTDFNFGLKNSKTGIFYLTTTNGPTVFEDGVEVDCIENRMVIFPATKKHMGTVNTDNKVRVLINLNWF